MTDTAQPHNPNEHNAGERTLEERRAALKALMAAESTDVQEYHAVISGSTEEERASLARTLTPKSVIGSDHINRTPLAAYVAGALVRTPDGRPVGIPPFRRPRHAHPALGGAPGSAAD